MTRAVSPITVTMFILIVGELVGLKVPESVYEVRIWFESPSKLMI